VGEDTHLAAILINPILQDPEMVPSCCVPGVMCMNLYFLHIRRTERKGQILLSSSLPSILLSILGSK
jgi:hypothetical protein